MSVHDVVEATSPSAALLDRAELIEFRQVLPGSPEEVFDFFADARNLERITPPWLRFKVLTPGTSASASMEIAPIEMAPGTLIDYRLSWRGIPIRWRTLISEWQPPFRFVDEQIRGPYRVWRHEHTFERRSDRVGGRDGDSTVMRDRVQFLAPFAAVSHPLVVRRDVERIFAYRRERIAEGLGSGARWSSG